MRRQEVLHDYIGYGLRIMSKFIPEKGNLLLPARRFSHIGRLLPEWTISIFAFAMNYLHEGSTLGGKL